MKIAFFTYPSAFQNVGGGEILLMKTKEYLEKEGATVDLFDTWRSRIERYDILHVFGSVKECLGLVRVANARRVKVAITPLLWSDLRMALHTNEPLSAKVEFLARYAAKAAFPAIPSGRRKLLLASDLVFPNSRMELEQTARHFAVPRKKMRVVYNGVDRHFLNADPKPFLKKFSDEPFVLGVGRIEPRKNQLNLIRALAGIPGQRLILIGNPVSGYETYHRQCMNEGKAFTTFLPAFPHEDPMLKSAYAACGLFVLQGWFETPGLVALEAILAGAKVLITAGGSTKEYFKEHVDYFDPSNVTDLRAKIRKGLTSPTDKRLKDHVLEHFTWDSIAKETMRFYAEALA